MPELKLTDGTRTITLISDRGIACVCIPLREPELNEIFIQMHVPGQPDVWLDESNHKWTEVAE